MDGFPRLPIGGIADQAVQWVVANLSGFFDVLRTIFVGMYDALAWVLSTPSFWVIVAAAAVIALLARGWVFATGTAAGLLFIVAVGQWDNAMATLALILVATVCALLIAIPLGILAAKNDLFSKIIRPVLDFLQTMPAFVYLIPALLLFRVGVAPGIIATIIFAMAPGVRLTELGIRGVDREVVEAGHAFGASGGRILRQIQLPLALPTIMAGVNQVIMLALSMVVIAGMVGAGGLGGDIVASLNRLDTALGVEAGLAVVIIAIFLDRLTGAFGLRMGLFTRLLDSVSARGGEKRSVRTPAIALAILTVVALGVTAFSSTADDGAEASKGEITIAVFSGWGESIVSSQLWKAVLEDEGYAVTIQEADVAPVFSGVSTGDYDFTTQVSLPEIHSSYVDSYGADLEDLGSWYDESVVTVAVNADAPIDSLEELAAHSAEFGDTIVGIEAGAGQTMMMQETVIPGYGLDDMTFTTSSTAAMLAELQSATTAGENVVVSLWEPHWAYAEFPIKNLADPKGLLGEPESLHTMARTGFAEDHPEVAAWIGDFTMDKDKLLSLEKALLVDSDGDYGTAIQKWIGENQEWVDGLTP